MRRFEILGEIPRKIDIQYLFRTGLVAVENRSIDKYGHN
jgi:hypothetical protein